MAAGFCSICNRAVRGSMAVHVATQAHKNSQKRRERTRAGGARAFRSSGAARRGKAASQARRSEDKYLRGTLVKVRTHNRSRPNDGTRKVVKVKRHYRHPAQLGYEAWARARARQLGPLGF